MAQREIDQISILTFQIGWEEFVIDLLDVKEIIQAGQIRKLPKSIDYIDGIYNYRGEIIHVINLKKKLELDQYLLYQEKYSSFDEESIVTKKFIIILKVDSDLIGFYVDLIISIDHILPDEIVELSPIFQTTVDVEYIKGIVKLEDKPRILINLRRIAGEVEENAISKEISSKT